jgi:CRISPR-associated protein Cmr6
MTNGNGAHADETPAYKGNIGLWFYRTLFDEYFKAGIHKQPDLRAFLNWLNDRVKPVLDVQWEDYGETSKALEINPEPAVLEEQEEGENNCSVYLKNLQIDPRNASKFRLKTIYPGLVCGIGYEHELGFPNEFKLGFSFDHTTGLPYIPGSSVKGTLRSAFKHADYPKSILEDWITGISEPSSDRCFPEILKGQVDSLRNIVESTDWQSLEKHIFDGIDYLSDEKIGSYRRDVFFDAYITGTSAENKRKFLADDYITCHQNREHPAMTPFTNPNPVRFIKVRSEVEFEFSFRLFSTEMPGGLCFTKQVKEELFKQILLDLGIGAKTNVGYGQLEKVESVKIQREDLK